MPTAVRRPPCKPTSMTGWWHPSTAPSRWPLRPTPACSSPPSPDRCGCTRAGSCCRPPRWTSRAGSARVYSQGLLGVTVDPNFAANHYVYLFYTYNKFGSCPLDEPTNPNNPVNRVSRFVMSGDTLDPASEVVLIDNIPSHGSHNAGDLHFGKDGYLYVSTGDGVCDYANDSGCDGQNDAARDRNVLLGKILRITRNGGIPKTNPLRARTAPAATCTGRTDRRQGLPGDFRYGSETALPLRLRSRRHGDALLHQRGRSSPMGRGRRRQGRGRLRLEPLRGQPRQPGPWRVGRLRRRALHSPHPRVQSWHRVLLHHRRGVRAKRLVARQVRRLLSHGRLRVQQDLRTYTQGGGAAS